ncbi:hypothetical protein EWM64_g4082 [Hericium alpestre]|uniref:PWWP domain-containing protein n=1 Tax=Hericium alpestre TaxID=135208 RepID=A0A4Z0A0H3_9AGAM|nr:hypothetical protein EWM64_g4082 [Hericium alpestre]
MNKKSKAGKDTKYEYRDVVLAKVRGYPPWPGMVIDPDTVPADVARERPQHKKSNFYCVRFFPRGEHAWLVSKDISKLQTHEIEAYINEPYKKSGELLTGYRIALDPSKWEEKMESERAEAAEEEANEEVDQLENESIDREADADGDDEEEKKPKKRKRDSEAAKPKAKGKAKKESAEPASKKKAPVSAKGKKNGVKSKAMVESEDDGGDAEGDEDAGPSKQTSPPPAKKAKREKDEDPLASDPEAVKVKEWRTKLQKTFLNEHKEAKPEDMPACDELFTTIEQYDKMNLTYLSYSKIGKVMRHIYLTAPEKIPRDEEFQFRDRARVLINKWQAILNAAKDTEAPASANGTAEKKSEAPADTKISESPEKDVPEATTTDDTKMDAEEAKAAPVAAELETNGTTVDHLLADADADTSALPDVTMSEA